jgi:hypothetical protein
MAIFYLGCLRPSFEPSAMPINSVTGFTPAETARYTEDMLESLRRIAHRQGQPLLAHLLDLAAVEAKIQSGRPDHDTALPG